MRNIPDRRRHDGRPAFTPELLREIEAKGVDIARVTLHVGLGTFRPVKVDDVENHHMHSEFYMISEEAAEKINRAKDGRVGSSAWGRRAAVRLSPRRMRTGI